MECVGNGLLRRDRLFGHRQQVRRLAGAAQLVQHIGQRHFYFFRQCVGETLFILRLLGKALFEQLQIGADLRRLDRIGQRIDMGRSDIVAR